MAYSYGMQGAPANGNGAPGLPSRKQADQSTYTRIVSGSGVLIPPQGAKFMRVAVIGGGGGGYAVGNFSGTVDSAIAGSGGGCAASKLVPAAPITYAIGAAGTSATGAGTPTNGEDTVASFANYNLIGGGGKSSKTANVAGGVGLGGDYNFTGGSATRAAQDSSTNYCTSTGGGAAGPNGNGGDGIAYVASLANRYVGNAGIFTGTGWGSGGGSGGSCYGQVGQVTGGAGTGAFSGAGCNVAASIIGPVAPSTVWGLPSASFSATGMQATAGGEMGGGGSAASGLDSAAIASNGGSGGMVVEWFY